MDRLDQIALLLQVARLGSFTRAAAAIGTRQSTVSKAVAAVEARLGVALFARTPRGVVLTEDGARYLERAQAALSALDDAERAVQPTDELQGGLRVGAPAAFGRRHLAARLARFASRHPALRIELVLSDHAGDLAREGLDMAIRLGALADSRLVGRRIGATRRVLVAAPGYVESHPAVRTLADLDEHDLVVFRPRAMAVPWSFETAAGPVEVPVRGRFESDDAEACLEAAVQGLGLALLPSWLCDRALAEARLAAVPVDERIALLPIHALLPGDRAATRRARETVGFLAEEFRVDPGLTAYGVVSG